MKRKLTDNVKRIEQRIEDACQRVDRDVSRIKMVAVTKTVSLDVIRNLLDVGVRDVGESKVQELDKRAAMIQEGLNRRTRDHGLPAIPRPRWHMVGHLQRNKVKALLPWVEMIHSVDSLRLAEEIDAQAAKIDRVIPILVEINVSGESAKHGVAVAATTHLVEQLNTLDHLEVHGLMAMGPLTDDETRIRLTFERVQELYDEVVSERACGPHFKELSMGMSNDFEHAIEFGATIVRIGTALFEGIEMNHPAAEPAQTE